MTNACKIRISVSERIENFVGKGKYAGYQHFLLFQQCFLEPSLRFVKSGSCVVKGKEKKIVEPFPKRQILDSSKLKVCRRQFQI